VPVLKPASSANQTAATLRSRSAANPPARRNKTAAGAGCASWQGWPRGQFAQSPKARRCPMRRRPDRLRARPAYPGPPASPAIPGAATATRRRLANKCRPMRTKASKSGLRAGVQGVIKAGRVP
jgi:hypothetical protein